MCHTLPRIGYQMPYNKNNKQRRQMSHPVNTEILENLYQEILDDLSAKNIQWGVMSPMSRLEEIAAKEAEKRFVELAQ